MSNPSGGIDADVGSAIGFPTHMPTPTSVGMQRDYTYARPYAPRRIAPINTVSCLGNSARAEI